jgi:uncharacterized protein
MEGDPRGAPRDRRGNQRHGIAFEEAKEIFSQPVFTAVDDRMEYGEERLISIGMIGAVAVVVVVHTERSGKTRIISARKANRRERQAYHEYLEAAD